MNSLRHINDILDDHFNTSFDDDWLSSHETQDETIAEFEFDYGSYYNSETDFIDFEEIKQLCDFNKVMSICAYVAEKYDEYDMVIETSHFEDKDKILKAYIYFYMEENHKQEFIQRVQEYDFDSNENEETEEDEEYEEAEEDDESEDELPPAQ